FRRSGTTRLSPASKHLRYAPRLRNAATRCKGRFRVKDLADRTDASLIQVRTEAIQKFSGASVIFRVHFQPGIDERTDQPGPYSALMISGVPRAQVTEILCFVIWMVAAQRTQANGREQFLAHYFEDRVPILLVEHCM